MKTDEQILEAVRSVLNGVADIGQVDIRFGGDEIRVKGCWARLNYWIVTLPSAETRYIGLGKQAMKYHTVNIEGWMPRDYKTNSADRWRKLKREVETALLTNPSLSLQVSGMEPPRLVVDDEEDVVFGEREEAVLCHHALFEVVVKEFVTW